MKVVHLCFVEPYLDNWSYQANLLPEYQAKAGHDVAVIAALGYSPEEYSKYKEIGGQAREYTISRVRVIRLPLAFNLFNRLVLPRGLKPALEREKPDVIFMHSLNNLSIATVSRYKKKHGCRLFADAHADQYNSGKNPLSKVLLHGFFWRLVYAFYQKNLDRVFAITKDCADFAEKVNGIDGKKIELLNLGADTDAIRYAEKPLIRREIRDAYGLAEGDFVIATAGKISAGKKIDLLIEAVKAVGEASVKLLIIGSVDDACRERLKELSAGDARIVFTGWQDSRRINDFFLASDIAAFPGSQSVLWQQAICCGLPTILRWWGGTVDYLNIGNALFLKSDEVSELAELLRQLRDDRAQRESMSQKAMELCGEKLSYDVVAARSLADAAPDKEQRCIS